MTMIMTIRSVRQEHRTLGISLGENVNGCANGDHRQFHAPVEGAEHAHLCAKSQAIGARGEVHQIEAFAATCGIEPACTWL